MSHINGSPFSWRVRVFWLVLNLSTGNREKIFHQRSQSGQFVFSFFCPVRVVTVLVKGWRWPVSHFLCRWLASQTENGSTSKVCTMTETCDQTPPTQTRAGSESRKVYKSWKWHVKKVLRTEWRGTLWAFYYTIMFLEHMLYCSSDSCIIPAPPLFAWSTGWRSWL